MKTTDENLQSVHDGKTARLIRNTTEDFLLDQEESIITALIREYRAGTLTNDNLRGSIGEIAGLRSFREYLEIKIRKGIMSAEQELGQNG